jgi:hypothetical protein
MASTSDVLDSLPLPARKVVTWPCNAHKVVLHKLEVLYPPECFKRLELSLAISRFRRHHVRCRLAQNNTWLRLNKRLPVSGRDSDFSLRYAVFTGCWSVGEVGVKSTGPGVEHVTPIWLRS